MFLLSSFTGTRRAQRRQVTRTCTLGFGQDTILPECSASFKAIGREAAGQEPFKVGQVKIRRDIYFYRSEALRTSQKRSFIRCICDGRHGNEFQSTFLSVLLSL